MEKPDVPLWCVWAIQQYAKEAGKERCRELYMGLIRDIVDYLLASKHPNLTLDENGLLYADAKEIAPRPLNGGLPSKSSGSVLRQWLIISSS